MEYTANNHLLVSGDGKLSLPRISECIRYLSSALLWTDSYIHIASEVIVCPITFTNGSYLLTNDNAFLAGLKYIKDFEDILHSHLIPLSLVPVPLLKVTVLPGDFHCP